MLDLAGCASDIQSFLEAQGVPFAFIGGVANLVWGKARFTDDVDLSVFTGFAGESEFIDATLAKYRSRHGEARKFALQARVLLLIGKGNIGIDIGLCGFPYEEDALKRSSYQPFSPGVELRVIGAEDLVLMKAFAGRPQDWLDISGISARQGEKLDRTMIMEIASGLAELKEDGELMPGLERALNADA